MALRKKKKEEPMQGTDPRDEALDKWKRATADYQNLRRRTLSDVETARHNARADVLGEAVTILDYLEMALAAPVETEEAKNLQVGVQMTRDQLRALFDRFQVTPISTDVPFDPAVHQAVATVSGPEAEPGTIVDVVRTGWMLGDQVLRHAQVRVAVAPDEGEDFSPSAQPAEEAGDGDAD